MLPCLVSTPPLAQNVGTSPPQNRYGTSITSALATSPTFSCSFSCFSIRSWNVSARQKPATPSSTARAAAHLTVLSLMLVSFVVARESAFEVGERRGVSPPVLKSSNHRGTETQRRRKDLFCLLCASVPLWLAP